MKTKNLLYSVLTSIVMLLAACTPDSDSMGALDLTSAQLAENAGFSVDVDQATNQVTFKSLLPSSYSVYWEYGPAPSSEDVLAYTGSVIVAGSSA